MNDHQSYLQASKDLHESNPNYGKASEYKKEDTMKFKLTIPQAFYKVREQYGTKSLLDYGTGKGGLIQVLQELSLPGSIICGYDPAVKEFQELPDDKFEVVTSIDVLEHINHKEIDRSLAEIQSLTRGFFFFCIDLFPASKKTQDKRNAHFLIAPSEWWIQKIKQHFDAITCVEVGELNDGSKYPMHLIGCATNSMKNYNPMCCFLANIKIANMRWVWTPEVGGVKFIPYRD